MRSMESNHVFRSKQRKRKNVRPPMREYVNPDDIAKYKFDSDDIATYKKAKLYECFADFFRSNWAWKFLNVKYQIADTVTETERSKLREAVHKMAMALRVEFFFNIACFYIDGKRVCPDCITTEEVKTLTRDNILTDDEHFNDVNYQDDPCHRCGNVITHTD